MNTKNAFIQRIVAFVFVAVFTLSAFGVSLGQSAVGNNSASFAPVSVAYAAEDNGPGGIFDAIVSDPDKNGNITITSRLRAGNEVAHPEAKHRAGSTVAHIHDKGIVCSCLRRNNESVSRGELSLGFLFFPYFAYHRPVSYMDTKIRKGKWKRWKYLICPTLEKSCHRNTPSMSLDMTAFCSFVETIMAAGICVHNARSASGWW